MSLNFPCRPAISPDGDLTLVPAGSADRDDPSGIAPLPDAWDGAPGVWAQAPPPAPEILLRLVGPALSEPLPPAWAWWRDFASSYLHALCHAPTPDAAESDKAAAPDSVAPPSAADFASRLLSAPPMTGGEYLSVDGLSALWAGLDRHARALASAHPDGLSGWAQSLNPAWRRVGRVCFHLAENKRDPDRPFAFLATYAARLAAGGRLQHMPLSRALTEFAGAKNKPALVKLLAPVRRAAETSALARELVDSGEVFHPVAWTPAEAYRFLQDVPAFEDAGLSVRVPDWWKKRPRPVVKASIGKTAGAESLVGRDALLSFDVGLALGDAELTPAEWRRILEGGDGLALLRGQWVEVDRAKLQAALDHWKRVEKEIELEGGVSFLHAMRLLAGAPATAAGDGDGARAAADWSEVSASGGFAQTLARLRAPEASAPPDALLAGRLLAKLRPYQSHGVNWLRFLSELGLGACLADDMGLGKTIQVLSLLLLARREGVHAGQDAKAGEGRRPSLLVMPASLLGNWKAETGKFAPTLSLKMLHPAFLDAADMAEAAARPDVFLRGADAVLTSYGMAVRQPWLAATRWRMVILDEAQAIKNPGARQTKFVKTLDADARIALTGTPVENRLSDLWSLFDFLNPGLLGSAKAFSNWMGRLEKRERDPYAPLRKLTGPYILRRLKTDPAIRGDLPDKTEVDAWCALTKKQAALYAQAVFDLKRALEQPLDGIKRQGLVLSFLTRFKQLCNHPDQGSGSGAFAPGDSGKFSRLAELASEIAARQERCLVFTQFKEMTAPLADFLAGTFGRAGLVLHGETPVKERKRLVDQFQAPGGPPFFVLSLKAGGTGLNLTSATQVVHFDRWWNPAVENQATDRAYRIGQRRNVLVHKFICLGTVEEKIDLMIKRKKEVAEGALESGVARALTDMTNDELLRFVALDARRIGADE